MAGKATIFSEGNETPSFLKEVFAFGPLAEEEESEEIPEIIPRYVPPYRRAVTSVTTDDATTKPTAGGTTSTIVTSEAEDMSGGVSLRRLHDESVGGDRNGGQEVKGGSRLNGGAKPFSRLPPSGLYPRMSRSTKLAYSIKAGAYDPGESYFVRSEDQNPHGPSKTYGGHKHDHTTLISGRRSGRTSSKTAEPAEIAQALAGKRDGNVLGNAVAFVGAQITPLPDWFGKVFSGYKPTVEAVFDHLPVFEPCYAIAPSTAGVIRLQNIPYSTTPADVVGFFGAHTAILGMPPAAPYHSVHIIVDRTTGKTMDALVEVVDTKTAAMIVGYHKNKAMAGSHSKLGDRSVDLELSSQEELMGEMFQKAKKTSWASNTPIISTEVEYYRPGVPSSGFDGFLHLEELFMLTKFADEPYRSQFMSRYPLRVYEALISCLYKYPWHATEHVFLSERDRLFTTTMSVTKSLILTLYITKKDHLEGDRTRPTIATLKQLAIIVLTCPGFSEPQKASFIELTKKEKYDELCSSRGMNIKFGGTTQHACSWPFKVLARDPKIPDRMVDYFMSLMRTATVDKQAVSLAERHRMRTADAFSTPFGKPKIDYGDAKAMKEVGEVEMNYVEQILGLVLPSGGETPKTGHAVLC